MQNHYFIYIDVVDAAVEVKINGASIEKEKRGSINTTKPVNKWIRSGENTLELSLAALKKQDSISGRAEIMVYLHDNAEDFPTPKVVLAKVLFPNEEYKGEKTYKTTVTFELADSVPALVMDQAEEVPELSAADTDEIVLLIEGLRTALTSGDYKKAVELQKYKIEEDARIDGKKPEDLYKVAEETFQMIGKEQNLVSQPFDNESMVTEAIWNGKMYKISRNDGEEAITIDSDDLSFAIPIFVSKISGQWKIVR
ncbi:hypothetical protein [Teredinibacter sp. KSP-S5-2]|uniref:hypothetical protein n=1 Tax=Teredinibacter sp. KSP-S5-2 TaxID=3034506 RepID=UPI002934AB22|nr:hypothetical protein [Teredinibacter sp. KSP-S5-2]WNO08054.1 hypothetical protein P5V12_13815 [Teredinibacter sp. KSP-S5-2]